MIIAAISVTLGLPAAMENWTNEQVLKFIRVMWDRHRHEKENAMTITKESSQSISTAVASEGSVNAASEKSSEKLAPKVGPSDPATVVAAAKNAFAALGDAGGALLTTEEPQRAITDSSPIVSSDAVMLEKTASGTVRVPPLDDSDDEFSQNGKPNSTPLEICFTHVSTDSLCTANGKDCPETPMDPLTKKRNMEWLRLHYRSLNEMVQLPYVHADLLQLYRYFYSPVDAEEEGSVHEEMPPPQSGPNTNLEHNAVIVPSAILAHSNPMITPFQSMVSSVETASSRRSVMTGLQRKASYRGLQDIMMGQSDRPLQSSSFASIDNSCRRRPVSALGKCNQSMQPAPKRARNDKPRIDYFPRIKVRPIIHATLNTLLESLHSFKLTSKITGKN